MKTQDVKRAEAQERQAAHEALTLKQRIEKALGRPGHSKSEIRRLEQQIKARDKK